MALFVPSLLSDEISLKSALGTLEGYLQSTVVDHEASARHLSNTPKLFEYIFSVLNQDAARVLEQSIMDKFPVSAELFESSLATALLSNISLYFWSLDYPRSGLRDCHTAVDLAKPVLKALANKDIFTDAESPSQDVADVPSPVAEEFGFTVKKRQSQKHRKKASRVIKPSAPLDTKAFENLGISIPVTKAEAQHQAEEILQDQKRILHYYLETLRIPELVPIFQDAFVPRRLVRPDNAEEPDSNDNLEHADDSAVVGSEIPASYPHIQPMKAAFHFDSVEGFGEWRILVSTRADRNLREAKRGDQKLFRIILKKIKELSNGHFSEDNQKKLTGKDVGVPIYEAKMTRDTRLVYQVDCVREYETDIDRQVLRIFGIYTHAQLERGFWDAVGQHLAGKGKEYRKRCVYRKTPVNRGDNVYQPESFPPAPESDASDTPVQIPGLRDEDREELHSLLVLQKFVTFSQALLNSILADQDVQHVFHMSPAEQSIVKHNGSCYVLGRSGTGKTTTMLFKMLGIERTWDTLQGSLDDGLSRPRQIFVTQSRVLAEKVEEYYRKLTESHAAAMRTVEESAQIGAQKQKPEDRALVDQDEEEFWRGTLPKKFSDLQDEHFPLFVTFDQLCRLLEEDFRVYNKGEFSLLIGDNDESSGDPMAIASDYMLQRRDSFVSYGTFLQAYWPHLPQSLTKNLDPALIFAEVMGVIKGSENALQSEEGYLDHQSYITLSHRQQGTFANRREAVYELFLSYLRMKRQRRDWDAADRTRVILRGLEAIGVPGKKLDFVYVDEAQDNLLIDALVLRTLCKNPDGLFWAGDTAQTISVGSSFRFNDLKAFLYRLEATSQSHGSTTKPPESFQLTVNYRSHGGIVNCAHSVVQLITRFWPHAIDSLAEEKGVVDGIKPVFFSGWDQDTVQYEQFLFGASGSQIEFGAQQCILVRDDEARNKLQAQMGDIGLILTLYESKGLEFNDVLIYNFFEDSTVELSQWRVVLNALEGNLKKGLRCPQFDETRHSGVCRELKFLYVAVTRARKNLWIADCSEKGEPLRTFWTAFNLVKNCSAADEVPRLAMTSTAEEWAATARTLFNHRRYLQAVRCYERANLSREKDVSYAYFLREQARGTAKSKRTTDTARTVAYVTAANAFLSSAAVALVREEKLAYYRIAADCFVEVDEYRKGAAAYLRAEAFTLSAQYYRRGGLFDEAVEVVQNHSDWIGETDATAIIDVAKLHYVKESRLDRATRLFPSLEEALEYMEDYGFDVARATLLENYGRLAEAAQLHLLEGRAVKAIQLFMQDWDMNQEFSSLRHAESSVLYGLWQHLSFAVTPPEGFQQSELGALLKLAEEIRAKTGGKLSKRTEDKLTMFRCIARNEHATLQELGERLQSAHGDHAAALLCLDHAFNKTLKIQQATGRDAVLILRGFLAYCQELQRIVSLPHPGRDVSLQQLFGFQPVEGSENTYALTPGTFLHRYHSRRLAVDAASSDDTQELILNDWDLATLLATALNDRLKLRVNGEDLQCGKARAISPCPTLVVLGACNLSDCSHAHWTNVDIDAEEYHTRIRFIFLQIMIYETVSSLEHRNALLARRRFWLSTLYHTLYPVHHKLGAPSPRVFESIVDARRAIPVVKTWIRDLLSSISPWTNDRRHFLTDVTELVTLAFLFDRSGADFYIPRSKFMTDEKQRPVDLMRGSRNERFIVHDLVEALDGSNSSSISAGVLFLKTVVERQLVLNVNVLCQLFEYICASLIASYHLDKHGSMHDMTLNRRWLSSLSEVYTQRPRETSLLLLFFQPLRSLLREVFYGSGTSGYLLYDRNSHRIDNQLRNVFVARIYRSLCLVGYNIPSYTIRNEIRLIVISIRQRGRINSYPRIFRKYIQANYWNGLVYALRNTWLVEESEFDALIQLKEAKKVTGSPYEITGTHIVLYHNSGDIVALVNGEKVATQQKSNLRAEASPFVPRILQKQPAAANPEEDDDDDDEEDQEGDLLAEDATEDAGIDHTADLDAVAEAVDAARVEQVVQPPTQEELRSGKRILSWYRRIISRRNAIPKKGLPEARARLFLVCLEFSRSMAKPYRLPFLGPFTHALVCMEKLNAYALNTKKKANLRIGIAQQEAYEKVTAEVDQAIRAARAVSKLKNLLDPKSKSNIHGQESSAELKKNILVLQELSANVPAAVSSEWKWDLDIAVKGIVQERQPPKKKSKPELVVDDDDLFY